ncbi:unnamed protein product [Rotaria magnacalcarata]|uniref:Uncharacterized protein n=3 Tax=Rotaria magnacalcarata TaxID=392030 RepID=A0A816EV85_9BILA|nr:unnamed protein product [Rotaria magnacalcarata]
MLYENRSLIILDSLLANRHPLYSYIFLISIIVMLSNDEYRDIKWKLDNIPSTYTGKSRQNYSKSLRKKLKEHHYASTYQPFTPLPHTLHYINRTTSEETLNQINQTVTTSLYFTLDTESIQIRQRKNKPVLIQIQALVSHHFSVIFIFEMCHLPREHTTTFNLIKNLITTIFNSSKPIYIWGERDELTSFVIYNLFSATQLSLTNFQNLQDKFKEQWQQQHPHITSTISSSDLTHECVCEKCIGKSSHELWSLQDAVSYELKEWLDKRSTMSYFNIGLDPQLSQLNLKEQQDRQKLTNYAANDCLSMQRLLIKMQIITIAPTTTTTTNIHPSNINHENIEPISSDESEPEREPEEQQSQRTVTFNTPLSILEPKKHEQLSNEERKKIHNRTCTIKQRHRYYRHELTFRNIDRRFTIRKIKNILRQYDISFYAVNISTSTTTNTKQLYVGIRDPSLIQEYDQRTRTLFSTHHYNKINSRQRRYYSSSHSNRRH